MTAEYFADGQPATLPSALRGPNVQRLQSALGLLKDAVEEQAFDAVAARFPSLAPADALPLLGEPAGVYRADGESVESYRARVEDRWSWAEARGTKQGMIAALAAIGITAEVYETFTWNRHESTRKKHWFWVVVRQPHPFGTTFANTWGDGALWGEGQKWGAVGEARTIQVLMYILKHGRPAHAIPRELIIVLSGLIYLNSDGSGATMDGEPTPGSQVLYVPVWANLRG